MFSIIVTVYNLEKYIDKCIQSVLNQSFQDFELIIINDGSTDASETIIKKYLQDPRIKYYKKENGGIADTRNFGISKVTKDYILFIDGDDYIKEDMLEKLSETLLRHPVDLVIMGCVVIKDEIILEDEHVLAYENALVSDQIAEIVTRKYMDPPWKYCYSAKFWKKNNFKYMKGKTNEDLGLIPFIMYNAKSVTSLDYNGYYYVQRDNGITSISGGKNYAKTLKSAHDVFEQYLFFVDYIKNKNDFVAQVLLTYFSECVLIKAKVLKSNDQKEYFARIRKEKVINNITCYNYKKLIKKIVATINIKLYLKLFS